MSYSDSVGRGFRSSLSREAFVLAYRAAPEDGVAWITGASAGIGRALALRLAAAGWRVAVTARRAEALADLAKADPARILPYPADVTDADAVARAVAAIEKDVGPVVLAVLNAGVYHLVERERFDAALALTTIDTNLGGAVRCLDPVVSAMLPRGRGQIAIVASLAGYGGVPGSVAYGSGKAGVIALAEALRLTYAPRGLTVQVVNPGFVRTAMTAPNDYPMPFMMSAEVAAARIHAGLRRGGFEIAFPRRLAWPMKALGLLPYPLWLAIMARATRRATR